MTTPVVPTRVFASWDDESYEHRFTATLDVPIILGGIPTDEKVAEGWLRSKITAPDDQIRTMVAQVMVEREVARDEAVGIVNDIKNLNGFRRTPEGVLFIEGRQVKAAIKEAVSVAVGAGKMVLRGWGETKKFITNFVPEHVFVVEDVIELYQRDPDTGQLVAVKTPTETLQQFVHTHHGSSIQYQECVRHAVITFTVIADFEFTQRDWAMIWTTGENQGIGASRSQGYGTYGVTQWDKRPVSASVTALKIKRMAELAAAKAETAAETAAVKAAAAAAVKEARKK